MKPRRCKDCGALIRFVTTPTGRTVPVDAEPSVLNGRILLERGRARVVSAVEAAERRRRGGQLYTPHFATCGSSSGRRARPFEGFAAVPTAGPQQLELGGVVPSRPRERTR